MLVSEILPKLKANKNTYYNLDKETINSFKKLYSYLKKHKNKSIKKNVFQNNDALKNQINFWLYNENELNYVKKYQAMELISTNLNH